MFLPVGFGPEVHVNLSKSLFHKGIACLRRKSYFKFLTLFYSRDYTYVRGPTMLLYNQIKLFVSC